MKRFSLTQALAFGALMTPGMAQAQSLEGSPAGAGPIVAAVDWVRDTLLGNLATAVAVIAIAMVGFMMLSGRMNWRHGVTVIIGCFVLFGAATIAGGIAQVAGAAR